MTAVSTTTLNNGVQIPVLGFGVFQIPPDETAAAVSSALDSGYRLVDTAAGYGNERGVGEAVRRSGIPRDEIFVTTKLANSDHGYDNAMRAFDTSLSELGFETVDLYLVHWPLPAHDLYVETWRALQKLTEDGRARAIGVSNFTPEHLRRLLDETDVVPAVNQVELHPYLQQADLRAFHARHDIVTEAWSPLGQGKALLGDPTLVALADRVQRTTAQVVLRWHLQLGNVVIPKSVTPERIAANIDVFDFTLSDDDMSTLGALETGERMGPDPDTFNDR
ncbi:MAG: 2,5-diketo-D-gluconate reductase [Nocardioidaceae bacterium]|jgi:diketogulonate reductase-like aldo/keto reductase|nr:2,5-diketo-D-gluconate reductase [Nocardioidaceae bacterium]